MTPKIIVFSDFDGTITTKDTGTVLIDHCITYEKRRELDMSVLSGEKRYRDAVHEMWDGVYLSWSETTELLKDIQLDPDFDEFHDYLLKHGFPLNVVSAGLVPLCELFLKTYTREGGVLEVFANDVVFGERWKIVYRDESQYGHDKGAPIRALKEQFASNCKERPILIFLGDGISDISAAKEADFVFAKKGKDLEKWCCDEGVPHITWERLGVVLEWIKKRVDELGE
ncbi:hypothetical protein HDU67_005518 [Dinochytrium kinnereticum]|nr:hypothetical protein HDU67_005518 [Dinochytrium kinnereticum]